MTTPQSVTEDRRRQMIADAAYFRAKRRGFSGGDPVADWLEAEAEVDARLRESGGKSLLEQLEERLAETDRRLRAFKKKVSGMKADVREQWTKDADKLAKLRERLNKRLEEIRKQGEQVSEKAKAQADKTWHEISAVIDRVSSHKSGRTR